MALFYLYVYSYWVNYFYKKNKIRKSSFFLNYLQNIIKKKKKLNLRYSHLLTNLAVQILLGIPLELVHKFWRIGLIYILGGISGALSFFAFYQNHSVYLAGASGGVYALLSAHIANVIINWGEMDFSWLRTIILCIFISVDVGSILYNFYINRIFTNVKKNSFFKYNLKLKKIVFFRFQIFHI